MKKKFVDFTLIKKQFNEVKFVVKSTETQNKLVELKR